MSGAASELAALAGAVLFTALAVRLMDDYLDRHLDALGEESTLAATLGDGTLPYALLSLALAALLDAPAAGSLFLASYAVGMAGDWQQRMPSGLLGYQESLLAAVLGLVLAGPAEFASSSGAVAAIQVLDDLADQGRDRATDAWNAIHRLGPVEACLLGASGLWLGVILSPFKTVAALAAVAGVEAVLRSGARLRGPAAGGGEAAP